MGTGPVSSPLPGAVSRGCQSCLGVPFSHNAPKELISFKNSGKRQVGMISLERRCFYLATSLQEHRPRFIPSVTAAKLGAAPFRL